MTVYVLLLKVALAILAQLNVHPERAPWHVPGYMHCARTHVRLDEVLDTIRDNLRREQKTVMELNSAHHIPLLLPLAQDAAMELQGLQRYTSTGLVTAT